MPNTHAIRMLDTALEMERNGHRFYRQALERCENPAAREIFRMLMEDEVVHVDVIQRIYDSLVGGEDWSGDLRSLENTQGTEDLAAFFRNVARSHGDAVASCASDLEALRVGLDFERKAVRFYEAQLEGAEDPQERRFVELMIAEERTHVAVLTDMQIYLEDPEGWFLSQGRAGLDGA